MHTDDLHILIKSLTKAEKSYFKKASRFQKAGAGYLQLYQAMENMDSYDTLYIDRLFDGKKILNQLSVAKNYLYHTILRNLIPYGSNATTKGKIDRLSAEANILYEKRLYSQAEKIVAICKDVAFRHELFTELLKALEMEFNIKTAELVYDHRADRLMERIYKTRRDALKKIENLYEYDLLQYRFISFLHRYMDTRSRKNIGVIDKMISSPIMRNENAALSTISKMKFNHIFSTYYYVKGDLYRSYKHLTREIQLLSQKKELMNDRIHILLILLANQMSVSLRLRKFDEFLTNLQNFKRFLVHPQVSKSPALRFYVIDFSFLLEILFMCKTGNFEEALKCVSEFTDKLNENKFSLSKSDYTEFLNLKAHAYFGCGRYDEALEYLNQIINDKDSEANYRNYGLAKIFSLIVHLELENYDLLEYMVPSTYKYLVKRKSAFKFEKLMVNFFHKTLSINNRAELIENVRTLKESIKSLSSDPFEKNALEYFDIISWLESKIENKSYASIVRSKASSREVRF